MNGDLSEDPRDRDLRPIREVVEEELDPTPVFAVEDGRVWVSGMNAKMYFVAYRVGCVLDDEGYTVGQITDDGVHAIRNGGLFLRVREATPEDEVQEAQIRNVASGSVNVEVPEEWDEDDLQEFLDEVTEATQAEVEAAVRSPEYDRARRRTSAPIRDLDGPRRKAEANGQRSGKGTRLLSRTLRFLRGLIP